MHNVNQDDLFVEESDKQEASVLLKQLAAKLFILWPWLLLSVSICVAGAYFYFKYSWPVYKIHASILVQDDAKGSGLADAEALESLGLLNSASNVDNEVEILKSRTLMQSVVEDLNLNVRYFLNGRLKDAEIYANRPVNLVIHSDMRKISPKRLQLDFKVDSIASFKLTNVETKKQFNIHFGDTVNIDGINVSFSPTTYLMSWKKGEPLLITLSPFDATVQQYLRVLNAVVPNKQVSIINLAINELIPIKGEIILDALIRSYMQANVNDKNKIADSTMRFIDERLALVFKELSGIEKDIEGFKISNRLTDISEQSKLLLENRSEYSRLQTEQEVQLSVVNALEKFLLENAASNRIVPSSLVMQDPSFLAIVQKYNETQLLRDRMLTSVTNDHPTILSLNEQLKNIRSELLSSIASVKRGIQVSINELSRRSTSFDSQIGKIPAKERIALDFARQQSIKQELYLFLLKKREETAISKSSTLANARVIDPAKADEAPFKPKRSFYLSIGLLIGLIIPFGISFGKDFFNTRIASIEDITNATNVPILAEIGHNDSNSVLAVTLQARTLISEQLRALRTNMKFLLTSENDKTILITSSMSGEGKSFLSVNICSALSLAGKKVVLLELDLRKPKITENLKLQKRGLTNYIVASDKDWKSWIQKYDTFDVLSSGPLPPNPTELLMLPKMAELMSELKASYDYIIMDSAPIGLVTDAQILSAFADITLYVVRHGMTYKQQIVLLNKLYRRNAFPRMNIVVNDVVVKKGAYGYGYQSYGYGYGVYGD